MAKCKSYLRALRWEAKRDQDHETPEKYEKNKSPRLTDCSHAI